MIKVSRLFLLVSLSFLSVACAIPGEKPVLEPGCLDVIICSEPAAENHG